MQSRGMQKKSVWLKIISAGSMVWLVWGMLYLSGCQSRAEVPTVSEAAVSIPEIEETESDLQTEKESVRETVPATVDSSEEDLDTMSLSEGNTPDVSSDTVPLTSEPRETVAVDPYAGAQLSPERIQDINRNTLANPEAGCYQVSALITLSREEVLGKICGYGFPEYPYYAGHAITPEERAAIEANRNVDAVPETVTVQYGIITDNANLRTYPTSEPITENNRYEDFDYFQESLFAVGEMVAVLHTSADGRFVFVIGANDTGWVEREKVGFTDLSTLQQWETALKHPAVVTEPYAKLDNGTCLRMGTALPLLGNDGVNYRVWYPLNWNGGLELTELLIPVRNDISDGYLPFTYEAVVRRMQQMASVTYGWGDAHLNYDCSSTVGAVYKCFGIFLPRNTGQMHAAGTSVYALEGMSQEDKLSRIQSAPAGSLLVMRGHVVMYFGMINGVPMIAHNVTRYSENGTDIIEAYQYRTTSLYVYTSSGRMYLDAFASLIVFE